VLAMPVKLSQQDLADLKKQGFSEDEISKAVSEIEREELTGMSDTPQQYPGRTSTSAFSSQKMDDMAKYQLELNDLLSQTEHILKGDIIEWENGKKVWKDNPKPENNPLNREGIRKIMLELQNYINRHIILGDYEERDINVIMKDYGRKMTDFLFMKYEEMGMDTEEKRQEYASIIMNLVNLVYASYTRAKDGGERRSLREMISIQQSYQNQGNNQVGGMMPQQTKTRGLLNPMRYIGGKYG
jgi:hypothetical protein